MQAGILKRWDKTWGIVYAPGGRRYFLHFSNIKTGTPELGRIVQFEVGPGRSDSELPRAIDAVILDNGAAPQGVRKTTVRQ